MSAAASSSNSRLERLFVLLSSSSTASTRSLAAKQLGAVVKGHPGELHNLLERLHPLLHSAQWDTRMAAVEALEEILRATPEVKKCEQNGFKKDEEELEINSKLTFATFNLKQVLSEGEGLAATRSQDVDDAEEGLTQQELDRQKAELNKKLGLDVAAKLGVNTEDIFSSDDLNGSKRARTNGHDSNSSSPSSSISGTVGMSSREKNRLKRALSKQKQQQVAAAKRKKYAPKLYKAPERRDEDLEASGWALEGFCGHLLGDLFERRWESRHGAAAALREVVRLRGEGAGNGNPAAHAKWLEDASLRLLSVIARDRFGDFVSDQVVAPVRESASQALGSVCGLMGADDAFNVAELLLELLKEDNWQCRHGGLLGVSVK